MQPLNRIQIYDTGEESALEMPSRIELLGGLKARQGDRVIARFSTHKTGALLAYLAYHQRRAHTREELAELLWPEAAPEVGRHNLRQALLSLRRQLEAPAALGNAGGLFLVTRADVRLSPAVTTDVAELEAGLKVAAQAGEPEAEAEALAASVELYQGDLLPGYYDEWVLTERRRLAEACLSALRRLTRLLRDAGDLERALQYGRRAVAMDPLREDAQCELMRLYIAAGRPADAARQFHEMERIFREELSDTPSEEARALARQLPGHAATHPVPRKLPAASAAPEASRVRPRGSSLSPASIPELPGRLTARPAPGSTAPPAPRLPVFLTRFFGRQDELARLGLMLRDLEMRLITLTGAGGSGKTRLAVEAARRATDTFTGGVWFVPLADRMDAGSLPKAIADAMQLRDERGALSPLDRIEAFLGQGAHEAPALLVLDSFEHLIDEGAALLALLMERIPPLTCLVTSRQRLEIAGEHELAVPPLPIPVDGRWSGTREAGGVDGPTKDTSSSPEPSTISHQPSTLLTCPSVQLFVDRAQASRPDFAVTPRNAAAVAMLCQRLEGIPLALELAAARAQMLTPSQMVTQLEARFDFLVSRRRDIAPRHRTLRAALAWSYELLPADLQRFFAQLSVFHGRWTLEAAERVCREERERTTGQVLEFLTELRERSLILVSGGDDEMEYRMLETLREYAAEQLAPEEQTALRQRHAEYYRTAAEKTAPRLHGPEQTAWMDRLEADHDNFRAALAWCVKAVVSGQWSVVSPAGSGSKLDPSLSELATGHWPLATAVEMGLSMAGALHFFWHVRGHDSEGRRWLRELLAVPAGMEPTAARAAALYGAAGLAVPQGDFNTARKLYEECLAIRRALGHPKEVADTLCQYGFIMENMGEPERARQLLAESLLIFRELGDKGGVAHVLKCLGADALAQGDEERARSLFEECLGLYRSLGDQRGIAMTLGEMGQLALLRGENEQAVTVLTEHVALSRQLKDLAHTALALRNLAYAVRNQGDLGAARAFLTESLALRRELGDQTASAELLAHMGFLARSEGEPEAARACFDESLTLLRDLGNIQMAVSCLELLVAAILIPRANTDLDAAAASRAARLLAASEALRSAAGAAAPWPAERAMRDRAVGALRAAMDEAILSVAWAEGRAMSFEQALDEARRLGV
jgi:predicted ATPase/DNA-binding SARP family transcriptional activator